jgi:hypothetical protein
MTVKFGISLSDETHAAVVAAAREAGLPLSTYIERLLAREIFRRGVDDHNAMLREAGFADPGGLQQRVEARQRDIDEWKGAQRRGNGGAA